MDEEQQNHLKRTAGTAGLAESDRPEKRPCLTQLPGISSLPISKLIEKAYKGEKDCQLTVIEKLYYRYITPESLNINISKLLNIDINKLHHSDQQISFIEKLNHMEISLICEYNPDNILSSELGKNFMTRLETMAEKDANAQYNLGCYYKNFAISIEEKNKVEEFFTKAAEQGLAIAQYALGVYYYRSSTPNTIDPIKIIKYLILAANQGLVAAQNALGCNYLKGIPSFSIPNQEEEGVKLITLAAKQGYALAQLTLGQFHKNGWHGVLLDPIRALELFTLAAKQGNADAQYNLGCYFMYGTQGVSKDPQRGIKYFTLAAEQGNANAQYTLGNIYMYGDHNIAIDPQKGINYLTLAAEQGDVQAQNNLGNVYMEGIHGVSIDCQKGINYLTLSAEQGLASAQYNLGLYYMEGTHGVLKDPKKAIGYWTLAADQGVAEAQNNLGMIYIDGTQGVSIDPEKAIELITLAAEQGLTEAEGNLKDLFSVRTGSISTINRQKFDQKVEKLKKDAGEILIELMIFQNRNDSNGGINLSAPTTKGSAIPSLHSHYKQCVDYTVDLVKILNHLNSEEYIPQGFRVNCIKLKESEYKDDILKYCTSTKTEKIHIGHDIENKMIFSFGNAQNIAFSKIIEELMAPDSVRNQKFVRSVTHLEKLHGKVILDTQCKAQRIQYKIHKIDAEQKKDPNKFDPDKHQEYTQKINDLNQLITQEQFYLGNLNKISTLTEKILDIITKSTGLRNEQFKPKSVLWAVLTKED